jgi:hypothetical protein
MILDPNKSYTFSEIFELTATIEEVLAEFGYSYHTEKLDLRQLPVDKETIDRLQAEFYRRLPHIVFRTETARREFIVSDILSELIDHVPLKIEPEYPTITKRLRGTIDYLLHGAQRVIIIEAKNDEMERGFRQLAVELIAVAEHLRLNQLYGAVTTGEIWRFGLLDRDKQRLTRDLNSFSVPTGLHDLVDVLAGLTSV